MALKKSEIIKLSKTGTLLEQDVANYVLDRWDDYDNKKSIFSDVLYGGCISGIVGHLIYTDDCVEYYHEHKEEIKTLLRECLDSCGFKSPAELFGDMWDDDDIFADDYNNQKLLAWFGFKETIRRIASDLDF